VIALVMETARTFGTLVYYYQSTWIYNPEDSHVQSSVNLQYERNVFPWYAAKNGLNFNFYYFLCIILFLCPFTSLFGFCNFYRTKGFCK
jgi:hypothetical protein